MTTSNLKSVATGQEQKKPENFPAILKMYSGEIAKALPKHLNADNMERIALTCFRMNKRLSECDPYSIFASVIQAAQLGLRPGLMGECYLIPFKDKCNLQIGYQGLLELMRRSGLVNSIAAYLVHEKDQCSVQFGIDMDIKHIPYLDGDSGHVRFGYAVAKLKNGGCHVEIMTINEIMRIRDRSQNVRSAKRENKLTPWDTDFEEMARKTLIRRICKYIPKSTEVSIAISLNDSAESGTQDLTLQDAIDNTFVAQPIDIDLENVFIEENETEEKKSDVNVKNKNEINIQALYQEALAAAKNGKDLSLDLARSLPADMAVEIKAEYELNKIL